MAEVRLRDVEKSYGHTRVLDSLSLEIHHGEVFFLLGPSGCGKTTLLRGIAGFAPFDAGTLHFGDRDMTTWRPQRRPTAMVFQNYALWPHMTVAANVEFGLKARSVAAAERRRRVAEALSLVRLGDLAKRKPAQLSGGQQQRVALARALVVQPECLLLDEPLSNLDAKLRQEMRIEIRRIVKEHDLTALCVTHDQDEALSMADRMAVMFGGQIAQCGDPRTLYHKPTSARVARFLGETNLVDARVKEVAGGAVHLESPYGPLRSMAADISGSGPARTISIRPEAVTLVAQSENDNTIVGEIIDHVFLGHAVRFRVLVGQMELLGQAVETARAARLERGARVQIYVDPEDIVLLEPGTD